MKYLFVLLLAGCCATPEPACETVQCRFGPSRYGSDSFGCTTEAFSAPVARDDIRAVYEACMRRRGWVLVR